MTALHLYRREAQELAAPLKETLRYAGFRGEAPHEEREKARLAMQSVKEKSLPQAVYTFRAVGRIAEKELLDLGFGQFASHDLSLYLREARQAALFAATIGIHADMLVRRYEEISPSQALFLSAAGSNLIESFCDALCGHIAALAEQQGLRAAPRFSPGYGDFPLACQPGLLRLLDAEKSAGIRLNESLLMTPVKSVTAVIALT